MEERGIDLGSTGKPRVIALLILYALLAQELDDLDFMRVNKVKHRSIDEIFFNCKSLFYIDFSSFIHFLDKIR